MSISTLTAHDLQTYERVINSLRVNELQTILGHFKAPKLGKKQDLINRCISHLRAPAHQHSLVRLLQDMNRRGEVRHMPYTYSGHGTSSSHNGHSSYASGINDLYRAGGSSMYGAQASAMQPRTIRNIRPVPLPFYDVMNTVMEPMELSNSSGLRQHQSRTVYFSVPREFHSMLYQADLKPLPRHELQLRFYHLSDGYDRRELQDEFPLNCVVKLDDVAVTLPNIIPSNKPNVEPKRPSRPVNITQYCQPPRDQTRPHRLVVEWTADRRVYAVAVYLVYRVHADILRDRAVANRSQRQSLESTKQLIIRRLGVGDDDGITMDQLKISLLCPLGKTRMGIPARCKDCTHLQCFDLDLFLRMNEKKPTWKCAVCSGEAPYSKIIIDEYFQTMLRDLSRESTEVELLRDGSYRTIVEESVDLSSDDDDSNDGARPVRSDSPSRPAPSTSKRPTVDDTIIILDSDDEDTRPAAASAVTNNASNRTPPRSEPEIVTIDDTPPRPSAATTSGAAPVPAPCSRGNSINNKPPSIPTENDMRNCYMASTSQQSPIVPNCYSPASSSSSSAFTPTSQPQIPKYQPYSPAFSTSQAPTPPFANYGMNPGAGFPNFYQQHSWRPNGQGNDQFNSYSGNLIGRNMPNYMQQQQPYPAYGPPTDLHTLLQNMQESFVRKN